MPKNKGLILTIGLLLISNAAFLVFLWSNSTSFGGGVTIGKAAPRGAPTGIPELKGDSVMATNEWPDACSFVDQAEIKAILPEAKDIQQESQRVYSSSIKEFARDPSWKETERTESGRCLYSMKLPGETYESTQLWIRIEAVAAPKLITGYGERVGSGTNTNQGARGADHCALTGPADGIWFCRKGSVLFSLGGQTTAKFKGEHAPAPWVWRDDVLPEFVRTIAAKIK